MADNMPIRFKSAQAVGAILGAAYGDALGWPNERPDKSKASRESGDRFHKLRRWPRRSGGRFFPYEEIIKAGEYSDDTQLILCLSRSLLRGEKWFDFYTQVELPFWSLYERGGGGATKRAINSWLAGVEPWSPKRKSQDTRRYFEAGGNGIAMRVLPHVLYLSEKDFSEVATSIFLDGITTHGHPRALLGALVYGFALWSALRKESSLSYGELIGELISNKSVWSTLPSHDRVGSVWLGQAEKHLKDYRKIWSSVKNEILEYLFICQSEISKGALSSDNDVLKKLECFNKKINGAGTVTAVASVYLASRYAADPLNGVITAAFAIGSDTDTIASMAGGLLGCINGADWLSPVKSDIQDFNYLEKTALKLNSHKSDNILDFETIKKTTLNTWTDDIISAPDLSKVNLPDGRPAKIKYGQDEIGSSGKYKVVFRSFITSEGQTIYINKISKGNFANQQQTFKANLVKQSKPKQAQSVRPSKESNLSLKLLVFSIERSISFYKELLGFTIKKQNKTLVTFHQGLALATAPYVEEAQVKKFPGSLCVEVADIPNRYSWVVERKFKVLTKIKRVEQSSLRFFKCCDPDGNVIEVFEKQ